MSGSISEQIKHFHHMALRVKSLERAERFYCQVLGAEVTRRLGNHISVVLGSGPRLDLFQQDEGAPTANDLPHAWTNLPHLAWDVPREALLSFAATLESRDVGYDGISRNGPPGCAQIYVDDPDGNHLEFQCDGFEGDTPPPRKSRGHISAEWLRL